MSLGYYARTQKGTKRKWKVLLFFWKVPNTLQGRLSPVRNQYKLCKGAEPQVLHDEAFRMPLVADKSSQATRVAFLVPSLLGSVTSIFSPTSQKNVPRKSVRPLFLPSRIFQPTANSESPRPYLSGSPGNNQEANRLHTVSLDWPGGKGSGFLVTTNSLSGSSARPCYKLSTSSFNPRTILWGR